jgi:hypothetical protein
MKLMCKERVIYVMRGEGGFRGGAVGRSWVRFPMRSLGFSSTKSFRPVRRADNIATVLCRCLEIIRSSTSQSPKGLSRPLMV